jgi:hypothetical protein
MSSADGLIVISCYARAVCGRAGDYYECHSAYADAGLHLDDEQAERIIRAVNERAELIDALKVMTEHYVELAGSGDCGFWNPEDEPEVKQARAILARAEAAS